MRAGTVHVVGAGLAGLSAATRLAERGFAVTLHEAAPQAGGRCRSYVDQTLGTTIDNGNHLVLSGNAAALAYLDRIGARDQLAGPAEAAFDFVDIRDGLTWRIRPSPGRLPWWILDPSRRVPGTRPLDYLALLRLRFARPDARIGEVIACTGPLYERLWHPLLLAALNTEPPSASARLADAVIRQTLERGGEACRPLVAREGLSAAFVEPALAFLARHGAQIRFGSRLRALTLDGGRAAALAFAEDAVALAPGDRVVLAVPAPVAAQLLPGIATPVQHRAIVNGHFLFEPPAGMPPFLGVVGGEAEWIFAYPGRISTTTSGADRLLEEPREALAERLWRDVQAALGLKATLPAWQIVKERRATFAALPAEAARRPHAATRWSNLVLAGDYTATGLPATIEGAIRSGMTAADAIEQADGRAGVAAA
ncbi:hydroxysqualene dehydroxylase HpnE [Labrys wisconsinensis]|uniref:Squalene-associated FAD-dependent desaturase n=1 Tax=Labrys wisconsinensis TaxID=425677 RepID=A0ABU0JAX3_9HYPH|nr:hydroxysqualene dehydroxylase HpnE [Labrys wisconsinensis]MDQ0470578.1 squalene-associated FAD-dependent desaturase [Labrys wisconsinensis]